MKRYPVVLSTDDNYALYVAVTIQSLIDTTEVDQELNVFILYEELEEKTLSMFRQLQNERVKVVSKKIDGSFFQSTYEADYFTTAMYYRLAIPELFPEYEKVLYIDCDIILKQNIAALFEVDLSGYVIGAIYEYVDDSLKQYLTGISYPNEKYFNSGVLLINCEEFRKHHIAEECLLQIKKSSSYKFPDQDILNFTCTDLVYPIETKWNFKPFYSYTKPSFSRKDIEQYERDKREPALVHYTSGYKPWNYPNKYLSADWWRTAKNLQNTFGQTGKKVYQELRIKMFKFQIKMKIREIKNMIMGMSNG